MPAIGGSILSIARTAIHAHQLAVQVSANNISNAETEGYSRQRALLTPGDPSRVHPGWLGTGVTVTDVSRIRDTVLDSSFRRESAHAAGFGVRRDLLSRAEGVLGEPSESGLAAGLDAFWNAWADLANHPSSASAKSAVQQRGAQVARTLNLFDQRLDELAESAALQFTSSVAELNEQLKRVADLNERIVAAEVGGGTAGDLRDARDRAVDAAAKFADIRVVERQDGSYGLYVGNTTVVDGNRSRPLVGEPKRENGRIVGFELKERGDPLLQLPGGRLEGLMKGVEDIAAVRQQLDTLAASLVSSVNAIHTRHDADAGEQPGPLFFHQEAGQPVTAGSIRLSDAVRDNAGAVRAGQPSRGSTDTSIASDLARLRDESQALVDRNGNPIVDRDDVPVRNSFGAYYRDLVGGLAFRTADADRSAAAADILATQADTRRQSVSGVSIDEELILLMRHQQAYTAASRLVKVADEMLQTILQMV